MARWNLFLSVLGLADRDFRQLASLIITEVCSTRGTESRLRQGNMRRSVSTLSILATFSSRFVVLSTGYTLSHEVLYMIRIAQAVSISARLYVMMNTVESCVHATMKLMPNTLKGLQTLHLVFISCFNLHTQRHAHCFPPHITPIQPP